MENLFLKEDSIMVRGQMEPAASSKEMKEIFRDIDELIHPDFDFGDQELSQLREKISRMKEIWKRKN